MDTDVFTEGAFQALIRGKTTASSVETLCGIAAVLINRGVTVELARITNQTGDEYTLTVGRGMKPSLPDGLKRPAQLGD